MRGMVSANQRCMTTANRSAWRENRNTLHLDHVLYNMAIAPTRYACLASAAIHRILDGAFKLFVRCSPEDHSRAAARFRKLCRGLDSISRMQFPPDQAKLCEPSSRSLQPKTRRKHMAASTPSPWSMRPVSLLEPTDNHHQVRAIEIIRLDKSSADSALVGSFSMTNGKLATSS